jgi:DNA-binding response OmpR family regulator
MERATTTSSILVVEDHPPLRELIATVLNDAGYQVLEAANGEEAIGLAQGASIDLVLTDVNLPGISGPALIQQLRAQSGQLRVVLMSGHDAGHVKDFAEGALFLQKPFTPKVLTAIISKALQTPREQSATPSTGN